MKSITIYLSFILMGLLVISCGDENPVMPTEDFRDAFVGIYDCEKGSTTIELEVKIDPDNEMNLVIGPYSIPVDEDGSYGREELEQNVFITLRFEDNEIFYAEFKPIIDGLIAPCELRGLKRI